MENILTTEDKKYLRRVSNYLNSLGMKEGTIEFEKDYYEFKSDDIKWNTITHFDNNYHADIPDGLIEILKKILTYLDEKDSFMSPGIDGINYEKILVDIDTEKKEISVVHYWSYFERGETASIEFDDTTDVEMIEKWKNEEIEDIPEGGILTLKYNGSGDSGYIENTFDETGDSVPASIEDWCYNVLENNFGGWEINEGSDGEFIFDFNNFKVTLYHSNNLEADDQDSLYEESFAE